MARKGRSTKAANSAKGLAGKAKRRLRRPGNAAKTAAGVALGAAAIATTVVVGKKVADAFREGGEQVGGEQLRAAALEKQRPSKKKAGSG